MIILKAESTGISDCILKDEPSSLLTSGTVVSCTHGIYNEISLNQFSAWINKFYHAKKFDSGRDDVVSYEIL